MSKQADYMVTIDGNDITARVRPLLVSLDVTLNADAQSDSASLTLDDTGGQLVMPSKGAKISIALGWLGAGLQTVFEGTVDETRSSGSRGSGRTLSVAAKGFAAEGKAKDAQRKHWDDATVETILGDAARKAGMAGVRVDPELAKVTMKYWAVVDESFLAMAQRLARRIGGNFRIQNDVAIMAKRGTEYLPSINATYGVNLHDWDVAPTLGRMIYGTVVARYYNKKTARWEKVEEKTGYKSDAVLTLTPPATDKEDAETQAKAKAASVKQDAGAGSVTIEGQPEAVPDGACVLAGTRKGIDGTYRIKGVSHSVGVSSGFLSKIELANPAAQEAEDSKGASADAASSQRPVQKPRG